ncbi:hypothetical protein JCM6882_008504 [Rhodosporidiobolus microsporus]
MVPTLPPQVLELIMSQLFFPRDLAPLCLVSRAFLDPARRSLYHTVHISLPGASEAPEQYRHLRSPTREDTVVRYPHLAEYVRSVSVYQGREEEGPEGREYPDGPLELGRMLGACRNIRHLDLTEAANDFAPVLLAARPSLTHLHLNFETSYQELFPLFSSLRHLTLTPTANGLPRPHDLLSPTPLPSLCVESHFDDTHSVLPTLRTLLAAFCPPESPVLRRLYIPAEALFLPDFDVSAFPHLSSLGVQITDETDADALCKKLPEVLLKLPHLEGLALTGQMWSSKPYNCLRARDLSLILPPRLKRLALGLGFSLPEALCILSQAARRGLKVFVWESTRDFVHPEHHSELRGMEEVCKALGIVYSEMQLCPALTQLV